ncbi:hypothetical protein [Winogradskyella ursingii]|uniref:hypothetical protein n=1 Tax=Winogradskyella ursingii TaxID=2686079 RepID=UPI0015CEDF8C|nr:hypothetical protein [Winogradskyella ursingii]
MKILLSLFALVLILESCKSTKESNSESNENAETIKSDTQALTPKKDQTSEYNLTSGVTYTVSSRGTFSYTNISESKVSLSNDRDLKQMKTYSCNKTDWLELKKMIEAVNTKSLSSLKAPTDKRLYDGAPHATLSIRNGDKTVTSPTFDHGHPPTEIENLVNKVLSIKENVTKE